MRDDLRHEFAQLVFYTLTIETAFQKPTWKRVVRAYPPVTAMLQSHLFSFVLTCEPLQTEKKESKIKKYVKDLRESVEYPKPIKIK